MEFTVGRFLKFIITIIILIAVGWVLMAISSTLTIIIIAALIAYILDPLATYLEYRGLSRTQATVVVFIGISSIIIAMISFIIPPLVNELVTIERAVASGETVVFFENLENFIQQNIPFMSMDDINLHETIKTLISQLSSSIFSIIGSMVSIVTTIIIIPFAVFFLLKDGPHIKKAFISLMPNRQFEMVLNILYKMDNQIGDYLRGQFFDALIIGILATTALWILDVQYFIIIGIFAGLSNMIPYVGPLAGAVAAISVVLLNNGSGQQLILVTLSFILIQLMDNVLVQPLVVARTVNLHPLIIIFAVIIGGQFFGILGMLLAVPATGIIKVLSREGYIGIRKYQIH